MLTCPSAQALRQCAQHRQLDLTDAFEEYAGTGRDANLGVMAKNRFRGAMGTMFQGINLSSHTLNKICAVYNYGDPDPKEPGTCMQVQCSDSHSACTHPSIHSSIHPTFHPSIHPSIHPSLS